MKKFRFINKTSVMMLTAAFALTVSSCDKEEHLNPVPKTQISDLVAFDTPARISLQVNGLYAAMKNGNVLGGRAQIYGDILGDDFVNRTGNGITGATISNFSQVESSQNDVINLWTFAYQAINQCNVFIDGMTANADKFVPPAFPADFAATANANVAEARFIRAVMYHYMLQFYARPYTDGAGSKLGLPLRISGNKDATGNDLARSTVAEVYTQILADLDFAEKNLPSKYATTVLNNTRAHVNTAIAFKTRVYLTMGDYANVIAEAKKIVPAAAPFTATSGVPNTLEANIANVFIGATQTTNMEMILSMPFTSQNTPGTQNSLASYYRSNAGTVTGAGEYGLNTTAGSIYADVTSWPATDARRTAFVYKQGTEYFIGNKYPQGTPFLDRAPVIRWAEVLLNYSEALARTKGTVDAQALALLNAVRSRSSAAWAPADNATLIKDIMTERRIEFLGEGFRVQDTKRLLLPFLPKPGGPGADPASPAYTWPMPLTERLTNNLLQPN